MEYRRTKSIGLIKCSCGEEIRKGDYGYVPVIEKDGIPVFGRALCKKCKNKKDQDGSFQPDPVALTGEMVYMNRKDANKSFWYNTRGKASDRVRDGNRATEEARSL